MNRLLFVIFVLFIAQLAADSPRFPPPSPEETTMESQMINELGKEEVLGLPFLELGKFLWDRYVRGPRKDFCYGDCNPKSLSSEQAKCPATILLHASQSNQGQWVPLLDEIKKYQIESGRVDPTFTFNFDEETDLSKLIDKIEKIRDLYLEAGQATVDIHLVGHSLGAICSAEYAFTPELWVENTRVIKVISIAGRLKNIEPPTDTPYYSYCYKDLVRIEHIWSKIEENRGMVELYTIDGGDDWLVPQESVLIGDHLAVIPGCGHLLVSRSPHTSEQVVHWLFEEID